MTRRDLPPWLEGLTDPQIEAARADDENLWVKAGAGTGKTRLLVARYLDLHLAKSVPIRKLLAITFTEKAAGEMRERVAESLQALGKTDSLREIPHAPIHTIDSLCSRLIREYGERAGLDPGSEVLDPVEAEEWQERVWVRLLDRWWESRREDAVRLFRAFPWRVGPEHAGGVDPGPLAALIRSIRTAGRRLEEVPFVPDLGRIREEQVRSLHALFPEIERLFRSAKAAATREKLEALLSLRGARPGERNEAFARARASVNRSVARDAKEAVSATIDVLDAWASLAEEERLEEPRRLLGELALDFQRAFSVEKEAASVMDFLDLEEGALRILEREDLAGEIRSRFEYLLLDECQDTNELQLRLVRLLVKQGRLLAVGDAKQSIYAFRDADVTAFLEMDEGLGSSAHRVDLDWNFRSRPEILAWVNALFPRLWKENLEMNVSYAPLVPPDEEAGGEKEGGANEGGTPVRRKPFPAKSEPSVEVLIVEGRSTREARDLEANLLADRLRAIEDEKLDGLSFRDMALLLRSTTDLHAYEHALRARGIPTAVAAGRGFFQKSEVTDLLSGLSLIADPYDDLVLAAVLRSPLAGIDDEALAALLVGRKRGDPPLWDEIRSGERRASLDGGAREKLARFADTLAGLRALRGRVPPYRLLDELAARTRYVDSLLMLPDGLRYRANVRKLLELARALEERGELSIPEAIATLRRYRTTRLREPESALDVERDVVRLLTIHGAKGMEFPLVAVVDLGRRPRGSHPRFLYEKRRGVGVSGRRGAEGKEQKPYLYGEIEEEVRSRAEAEEIRLLYVALTRAERHLILSANRTEKEEGWLARITGAIPIPREEGVHRVEGVPVRILGSAPAGEKGRFPLVPARVAADPARFAAKEPDEAVQPTLRRILGPPPAAAPAQEGRVVTAVQAFARCPRRFHLSRAFPLPERRAGKGGGADVGTAFHRLMEAHWTGRGGSRPSAMESAELLAWKEGLLALPEIVPVARAEAREAEASFSAPVGGRPLRGILDLLARTGEGCFVLDYKTDGASADEILRRYRISLNLYKIAVRRMFSPETPVEAAIYAAREGKLVPVEGGEDEAGEVLARFDRAEREGEYPARENETCSWCPYRRGCPALEALTA
jgi:ATP-dependent helicase/nuclease subunit A